MCHLHTTLCLGPSSPQLFSLNIWHPPCLSSRTTLTMPPRRFSQHLHPDEDILQTSTQNQPPTHILSTIIEGPEHPAFSNIPEVQLHQPANMSTTAVGSSQNGRGTSSTKINGGPPHQSSQQAPSPIHVIKMCIFCKKNQSSTNKQHAPSKQKL
jgi:hypothetical protein